MLSENSMGASGDLIWKPASNEDGNLLVLDELIWMGKMHLEKVSLFVLNELA